LALLHGVLPDSRRHHLHGHGHLHAAGSARLLATPPQRVRAGARRPHPGLQRAVRESMTVVTAWRADVTGSRSVTSVPRSGGLESVIVPPWSSTILWVMASPSPVPRSFVLKNGVNTRSA